MPVSRNDAQLRACVPESSMLWKGIVTIKDNDTPFSKQFTRNGAVLSVNRAGKVHAVRSATAVHVTRTVDVPASTQVAPVPKP